MTDDSLEAYNFLMGKGKNLSQRTATADRPVMRRYDEAVLGRKIGRPTRATTAKTVIGVPGNPQSYFDEKAYLAANPSVADELMFVPVNEKLCNTRAAALFARLRADARLRIGIRSTVRA
jgi:hypothetical protein